MYVCIYVCVYIPARATTVKREQFSDDAPAVDVVVAVQTECRQTQGDVRLQSDHVYVHVVDHEGRKVMHGSVGDVGENAADELLSE